MRVLVTGANGFIGRALCASLILSRHSVVGAVRRGAALPTSIDRHVVPDLRGAYDWRGAVDGIDVVIHVAGRAHVMSEQLADPLALFRRVNVDTTGHLAEAAHRAGAKRFIFVSSIKVNGETTPLRPFCESDPPEPFDDYARSKWEAEEALRQVTGGAGMEHVILRPPLVYGPGVKANFLRLMELCDSGVPLPFGALRNRRSLIGLGNLIEIIERCIDAPEAANQTFLVRDPADVSIRDLAIAISTALGRDTRLIAVPPLAFRALGHATGQSDSLARLVEPLQIDDTAIRRALDWQPRFDLEAELAVTARWFRTETLTASRRVLPLRHADNGAAAAEEPGQSPDGDEGSRVSAVMVTYRTGAILKESIARLLAEPPIGELIIVDNGNDAAARDYLETLVRIENRARVITGQGNVGFAAGCNIGASYATYPYLLLINPDCVVEGGSLQRLMAEARAWPHPWIATPRLVDPDGREQRGSRRNHASPGHCLIEATPLHRVTPFAGGFDRINLHERPLPAGPATVPAISGAFMLMPTATFDRLGGMDERYFLHFEDLDFCLRLAEAGGAAYFVPHLACVHYQGSSASSPLAIERYKAAGMRRYFFDHFRGTYPQVLLWAIWLMLATGMIVKGAWRWLTARIVGGESILPPRSARQPLP